MNSRISVLLGSLCVAALAAAPALPHHSFAAYDQKVTKTVEGTLKELDWNAPHSGITVAYMDESGASQDVSVTTGAPATITGQGFKPKDFRIGSKVKVSWHPNRNGVAGGQLLELVLDDGRTLRGALGPPGAGGPPGAPPADGSPPAGAPAPGAPAAPPAK